MFKSSPLFIILVFLSSKLLNKMLLILCRLLDFYGLVLEKKYLLSAPYFVLISDKIEKYLLNSYFRAILWSNKFVLNKTVAVCFCVIINRK